MLMNTTCHRIAYVSSNCTCLMQWLSLLTTIVIIVASGSSVMMDSAGQMEMGVWTGESTAHIMLIIIMRLRCWLTTDVLLRMSKREKKYIKLNKQSNNDIAI